jgi:hypothetical protein
MAIVSKTTLMSCHFLVGAKLATKMSAQNWCPLITTINVENMQTSTNPN